MTKNNTEKATVLSDFFSEVFTDEPIRPLRSIPTFCDQQLTDINITTSKVAEELKKLDVNKSPGPDSVHPRVLKEAYEILSDPLCHIF